MTIRKPMPDRKQLLKRWRAIKLPRLYWKRANWRWYRSWGDEIARTANHRFLSYQAIVEFLEYCEELEKIRP